jgi:hypothetical protein
VAPDSQFFGCLPPEFGQAFHTPLLTRVGILSRTKNPQIIGTGK